MAPQPPKPADEDAKIRTFLEKASRVIAQQRGMTAPCREMLTVLARDLGMTDAQLKRALQRLQNPSASPPPEPPPVRAAAGEKPPPVLGDEKPLATPPPMPAKGPSKATSKEPGKGPKIPSFTPRHVPPVSEPPPPPVSMQAPAQGPPSTSPEPPPVTKPRPSVAPAAEPAAPPLGPQGEFKAYLTGTLPKLRNVLSERNEQKLVKFAMKKHGLSEVLARQLVHEAADEAHLRVASLGAQPPPAASAETSDDPRVAQFLERAAPIIAQQRGINVTSRVKLGSVARELGMSDEEMEQALKSLPSAAPVEEAPDERMMDRVESFRAYLRRTLAKLPTGILTGNTERKLVEIGRQYHGVTDDLARQAIHQVADERGLRFISNEQATRHVARLVEEKVGSGGRIDAATKRRLYAEGKQWGLTSEMVDAVVQDHFLELRKDERKEQRRNLTLITAGAVVLACVVGLLALMFLLPGPATSGNGDETKTAGTDANDGNGTSGGSSKDDKSDWPTVARWWDTELTAYIIRAKAAAPDSAAALDQLRSPNEEDRGKAYEEILRRMPKDPQDPEKREALGMLGQIIAGCHALDPSDENVVRLRQALLSHVPAAGSELPEDEASYRRAFWAVATAVSAFTHKRLSDERAAALAEAIGRTLGATIDRGASLRELRRQCDTALAGHLYELLIAAASSQPNLVQPLHAVVSEQAVRRLNHKDHVQLDTRFLAAVLPVAGDTWRTYDELIQRCTLSSDPLDVLKMVEAYERSTDTQLQQFLGVLLLDRVGSASTDTSVAAVAKTVREALGVTAAPVHRTPLERWQALKSRADAALTAPTAGADDPDALMSQVDQLAYLSTLGCALAQRELGYATFDELLKEEPGTVTKPEGGDEPPDEPTEPALPTGSDPRRTRMYGYIDDLNDRGSNSSQRQNAYRGVASLSSRFPWIDPEQGTKLARYLLSHKPADEHEAVMRLIDAVTKWRSVRLGLADELAGARLRKDKVQELMSAALNRSVEFDDGNAWKEQMRTALLRQVLTRLPSGGKSSGGLSLYDQSGETLHRRLTTQAKLLGIAPARYRPAATPSQLLPLLIEQYAGRLSAAARRKTDRDYLAKLPHELAVAEYLGTDDLRRTMLYSRIYLRLLAAGVAAQHPDRAAEADQLVAELNQSDAEAKHILTQLREGEEKILQMYLVMNRP